MKSTWVVCVHSKLFLVLAGSPSVTALRRVVCESLPDIVFAHGGEPFKFSVLARGSETQPKIIYRKIGLSEHWLGRHRWLKFSFQRWLMRRADAISTVGNATKNEAVELFKIDPAKIRVIYRGINQDLFSLPAGTRERVRESLGLATGSKVLISVGALGWEKNQAVMLRVLAEVRKSLPDVVLLLVGEGPELPKLKQITTELGIVDGIVFLGMRKDVPELLAAADLFILTSLTEGVPGVLIEAGMAGVPCVTWDVAGAKEVVIDGQTGLVTPYSDEVELTSAVLKILNDRDLACRFGVAAQSSCRERFGMHLCVDEHLKLFEDVLK